MTKGSMFIMHMAKITRPLFAGVTGFLISTYELKFSWTHKSIMPTCFLYYLDLMQKMMQFLPFSMAFDSVFSCLV